MTKLSLIIICFLFTSGASFANAEQTELSTDTPQTLLDSQVEEYFRLFPYQETYDYAKKFTGGDANALNTWVAGNKPFLVKAGQDRIVRTNNDTFYKIAFLWLETGPVFLASNKPSRNRFNSFQLMDDRNANYRNVIYPNGYYTLYYGEKPKEIRGEAIEVPSRLSVVIVRVEVKDKHNSKDIAAAKEVFGGISIEGNASTIFPDLDLLADFSEEVSNEATRRINASSGNITFAETIVGPGMIPSMSRKGNCWDNAVSESFFGSLKNELTYWETYQNRDHARAAIFEYIEIFYDRQRLHQTLNYVSPQDYEMMGVA